MTQKSPRLTRIFAWLGLCGVILSTFLVPATAQAQSSPAAPVAEAAPTLQIESRDGAIQLQWQGSVQSAATAQSSVETTSYGGYLLPLQTMLVELSAGQVATDDLAAASIQGMSSSPYTGELTPAPQVAPPALDWEPTPTNQPYVETQLPTTPLFVMAEGMQRGRRLATFGFSPIYQDPNTGEVLAVDTFAASIAGATLLAGDDASHDISRDMTSDPVPALANALGPTNALANTNAHKLLVRTAGMQQLSGAELSGAGIDVSKANKIRIFYQGTEVPLHIIDSHNNNRLDATDYVRFYAPTAGDTWNRESVYWLTVGSTNGLRMNSRSVAAGDAQTRNTAYEVGRIVDNKIYESTLAGADGDNWFHTNLRAETDSAGFELTLPHQLPLNDNLPTQLTLHLTPYTIGPYGDVYHRFQVSTSGYTYTDDLNTWLARFSGQHPFQNQIRELTLSKAADTWKITLLKETSRRAVMVDAIDYLLPVRLNFGGKGAIFQGIEETWRYQLTNTPTNTPGGRGLYDITDPAQPQQLTIPGGANFEFQDGPTAHRYLMTGAGTLATPSIVPHSAVNLAGKSAADTVYIAPKEFHTTLQPLVDLRKSQGYQVRLIDVQQIYDAWSFGMVDADAIRDFLRFAVGNWKPAPIAAVLVGDTTWDPHDYLGFNNPNHIPPYIANVDPWLKYVPCDSCYGQLDGDDPTGDYLIDVSIGRFPVIDTTELAVVVDKLIRYETSTDVHATWRSTSVQIVDDDVRPDGSIDTAGPFVGSAEHIVSLMPPAVRQLRNYYLAATDFSHVPTELLNLLNGLQSWFSKDPDQAMQRSIDLMNSGAGLVTYTGHGNHWQWARTVEEGNKWLFGLWEVRRLHNRNTPFIAMSMTCYTSQFHKPEANHFTLDEHLFLYGNGGAIATWGPTGFSIVPAHDTLQTGFHKELWKSPALKAKLGDLTRAGYAEVFASGLNLDVTKTYAMMGDPLTAARITAIDALYMPKLNR